MMNDIVSQVKMEFIQSKERIAQAFATTPDDKIAWSPTPSARTPIQLVAHAAMGTNGLQDLLMGKPFPFANFSDLDPVSRRAEKEFTSREQVNSLLEQTSAEYLAWLETLTPESLDAMVQFPFGPVPMALAITFSGEHLSNHAGQIDYIQTIYGDHVWY